MMRHAQHGLGLGAFGQCHETISLTVRLAVPWAMKATTQVRFAWEQRPHSEHETFLVCAGQTTTRFPAGVWVGVGWSLRTTVTAGNPSAMAASAQSSDSVDTLTVKP